MFIDCKCLFHSWERSTRRPASRRNACGTWRSRRWCSRSAWRRPTRAPRTPRPRPRRCTSSRPAWPPSSTCSISSTAYSSCRLGDYFEFCNTQPIIFSNSYHWSYKCIFVAHVYIFFTAPKILSNSKRKSRKDSWRSSPSPASWASWAAKRRNRRWRQTRRTVEGRPGRAGSLAHGPSHGTFHIYIVTLI